MSGLWVSAGVCWERRGLCGSGVETARCHGAIS